MELGSEQSPVAPLHLLFQLRLVRQDPRIRRALYESFVAKSVVHLFDCVSTSARVRCEETEHSMKKIHLTRVLALLVAASGCSGGSVLNPPPTVPPKDPDQRADLLVSQMTQDEKIQLVAGSGPPGTSNLNFPRGAAGYVPGIPRMGIPDLYFADGSVGAGNAVGQATALPSSLASAASWDLNEAYKYGSVIGSDMRAYGVNVNLGGNINLIAREPRDGRTFETKGEDPILAGKITAAHIRGVQDHHILGCIKHFVLNDQETGRQLANAILDERSARESDLLAFEIGIKDSNVQSVMCSYNLIEWGSAGNGAYSCENTHLLNDILKGDWGFAGFVMSDWWATHSSYQAAIAGLDQEQPDADYFAGPHGSLKQAIQSGALPQSRLDNMVHRMLRAMIVTGLLDYPSVPGMLDTTNNQAIAQEAEEQGAVLLKNAGGQLPLDPSTTMKIALIGSHADAGVLSGGGSAQVTPVGGVALNEGTPNPPGWAAVIWDPSSPLSAIKAKGPRATVQYNDGTDVVSAANLAASSDVAIVFLSQWASEGMDLPSLNFTDVIHSSPVNQDALVAGVAATNPHTVVVLENAGAQVMPWLANVSAVLEAWYPGEKGANAITNILFGSVNPSGKTPITFPASVNDLPRPAIPGWPNPNTQFNVDYTIEGFDVGYKWFNAHGIEPLFPFGFGLSYTTFSFSNLLLSLNSDPASGFQVGFDLTNTGTRAGAEVAQVYLGLPASTGEPPKRLVGWSKVFLQPGARQHVSISVDAKDCSHPLAYWDTTTNHWVIANGDYTVYVGNSSASRDLSVARTFHVGP
jgi:beta-glucosidase